MSEGSDISMLYREFADALAEVLAENAVGPARHGRPARARAAVKKHPHYSEAGMQSKLPLKIGKRCKTLVQGTARTACRFGNPKCDAWERSCSLGKTGR
jgi:hypothetical protein